MHHKDGWRVVAGTDAGDIVIFTEREVGVVRCAGVAYPLFLLVDRKLLSSTPQSTSLPDLMSCRSQRITNAIINFVLATDQVTLQILSPPPRPRLWSLVYMHLPHRPAVPPACRPQVVNSLEKAHAGGVVCLAEGGDGCTFLVSGGKDHNVKVGATGYYYYSITPSCLLPLLSSDTRSVVIVSQT